MALKNISAKAGSYGKKIITGESNSSPVTALNPPDANARYVSADESICTVDNITGVVTGVNEGTCRVTLTLSRTGYNDKVIEYVTPVVLSVGDFKGKHLFKGLFLGASTNPVFTDVDGDGDNDLVVGEYNGTLKYYRKNPSGSLIEFTELTGLDNPFNTIDVGGVAAPEFADIDGDGDPDLVVGESNGTVKYFLNESIGFNLVFTEKTSTDNPFSSINTGGSTKVAFADIDGDSDPDLVVGLYTGKLSYYLNESTTDTISFTAKTSASDNPFSHIDVGDFSSPTFADVDDDGDLDLIVSEGHGTVKYYLNESTGGTISFTAKTAGDNPFNHINLGNSSYPVPTFNDVDGDNKIDLVLGGTDGTLKYYRNESTAFTRKTESYNPLSGFDMGSYAAPTFADIDGDSDLDLVVGEYWGNLKYYLNESTENNISFTEKTSTDNPFNGFDVGLHATPTFSDIDGDSDLDLVVGERYGTLKYFLNEFAIPA